MRICVTMRYIMCASLNSCVIRQNRINIDSKICMFTNRLMPNRKLYANKLGLVVFNAL